jgi:UDP-N-acetylglucosamine 2-epimerase (non-hydrolysing)
MTIFGTRPEIIRLSVIIEHLDRFCEQVLVHTGQNYDARLSEVFFAELQVRPPDEYLGVRATGFAEQVGQILARVDAVLEQVRPQRVLILGDTNSGLASIVAARRGIPVFHLEAGNRCYDDRVPEEINRRLIDHTSTVLMPYTHRSKENLLREGVARERIFVVGNPILEVMHRYAGQIEKSQALEHLGLAAGEYFLVTMHRAENVDNPARLGELLTGLGRVAELFAARVIVSLHPRTLDRIRAFGLEVADARISLLAPLGFFDFVALERHARCVISDSGTVQEECCIFHVPNVTIRDVTERPETIECGSNILVGTGPEELVRGVQLALDGSYAWVVPPEYLETQCSVSVGKIVLGWLPAQRR